MTAKLIAEEGELEGLVLSFDEGDEWVIGRDPDTCQLLVEDPEVSREHLLARRTSGGIAVENLSTTNPALVNDAAIKGSLLLHHGDALRLGSGVFRYYTEIGGHEMEEAPAQAKEPSDTLFDDEQQSAKKMLAEIDFNIHETGRWMLKVIAGPNNGAEFAMEPGRSYVLGTNPETCDIVFHDGTVSRQHAKISISNDSKVTIQDLKSRNGVVINDKPIKGKGDVTSNSVVGLGTTRFLVFDREADRQTIITPLLPSIVKTLKNEDSKKTSKIKSKDEKEGNAQPAVASKGSGMLRKLVIAAFVGTFLLIIGMATSSLFHTEEVVTAKVDTKAQLDRVMAALPGVNYTFNDSTGSLLLIGHVLKNVDKAQVLYNLEALPFIREINHKNLVIDEITLQNFNQVIGKNPAWRGISLTAPSAGRFVLNGYLSTREQAEKLSDYMVQNFPYLDLLERRVFVEEDETNAIKSQLQEQGFKDVTVQMASGELTLGGTMTAGRAPALEKLIASLKKDAAIRSVRNYVVELATDFSVVDLTSTYKVTGSSNRGGKVVNVVINGRILAPGDLLDGMTVTDLKRDTIFLERDGMKYKIEYNK